MNWKIVDKSKTVQPKKGNYSDWKEILANEGSNQCVYCAIKDHRLGGIRHFHVEHYKPKSLFPELKKTIGNLFYACPICNVLKSNDWFDLTGDFNNPQYPDPSNFNYNNLFEVVSNGELKSKNNCGKYIINKLALNRRQLLIDRNFSLLLLGYKALINEFRIIRDELIKNGSDEALELLSKLVQANDEVIDKKDLMYESAPYSIDDTDRP